MSDQIDKAIAAVETRDEEVTATLTVTFSASGISISGDNVSPFQLFGAAAMIHEEAVMMHTIMRAAAATPDTKSRLVTARAMPLRGN